MKFISILKNIRTSKLFSNLTKMKNRILDSLISKFKTNNNRKGFTFISIFNNNRSAKERIQLSIRQRLVISFSIVLILIMIMTGITYFKISQTSTNAEKIESSYLPIIINSNKMNNEMLQVNKSVSEMLDTTMSTSIKKHHREVNEFLLTMEKDISALEGLVSKSNNPEIKNQFELFQKKWEPYKKAVENSFTHAFNGNIFEAKDEIFLNTNSFDSANQAVLSIVSTSQKEIKNEVSHSVRLNTQTINSVLTISISVFIITIILIYFTSIMITKPISLISKQVELVSQGDFLIKPLQIKTKDEIGYLTTNFNRMTSTLRDILKEVLNNSQQVLSTANDLSLGAEETRYAINQVATSIEEVSTGSNHQLERIHESQNTIINISKSLYAIKENIEMVSSISQDSNEKASIGEQDMKKIIEQINDIEIQVKESLSKINLLSERSKKIGNIVSVIDNISKQTNLLALNAAIEAARAGEHGKGFAVVADEVRKLANQSSKATDEIGEIIKEIQNEVKMAVNFMDKTNITTNKGKKLIDNAGENFKKILESTSIVSSQVQEVLSRVELITQGSDQIVNKFEDISAISQQTAANSEMVASSAAETNATMEEVSNASNLLSNISKQLYSSVNKFNVE